MSHATACFDPDCRRCPRLSSFLDAVKQQQPDYFCRPVPPFGDAAPKLIIVGLAPGMHGANRSGRPFTGDFAGQLLYRTLHAYGYASTPISSAVDDGLILTGCRITNAVKCLPPENKPTGDEIKLCNSYLSSEINTLPTGAVILALGNVAHQAVLRACGLTLTHHPFAHAARHLLPNGRILYDSYHCSRYNTQTGRLNEVMFQRVFELIQGEPKCPMSTSG